MKNYALLLLLPVLISSASVDGNTYWAIWGKVDVSTEVPFNAPISTTSLHLMDKDGSNCYAVKVNPNGTVFTEWERCK